MPVVLLVVLLLLILLVAYDVVLPSTTEVNYTGEDLNWAKTSSLLWTLMDLQKGCTRLWFAAKPLFPGEQQPAQATTNFRETRAPPRDAKPVIERPQKP